MGSFRVRLPIYFGPIEILVELIRQGELSIMDIALSEIAMSFLDTLNSDPHCDFEEVGEFLVMLSLLIEMKSRALLPESERSHRQSSRRAEISRQNLVRQVEELKRFQEAAQFLAERAQRKRNCLRRLADDLATESNGTSVVIRELEIWDLVAAFGRLMRQGSSEGSERIARDPTPLSVYQDRLEAKVLQLGRVALTELFRGDETRQQRVGKFLALLELIKSQRLWVEWDELVNELVVTPPYMKGTGEAKPVRPAVPPISSLNAVPGVTLKISESENSEVWPDLPQVPELTKKTRGWSQYRPMFRRDEPPQPGAST